MNIETEQEAVDALEAVLAWASADPQSTATGAATGATYQRGRVIATRVKPENTVGVSTYESEQDAREKAVRMEASYREWARMVRQDDRGRETEEMLGIPENFGGLVGAWMGDRAVLARCGHGRIVEALALTPLNALQLQKIAAGIVQKGRAAGQITDDHQRQADQLPMAPAAEQDREYVDRIAGQG